MFIYRYMCVYLYIYVYMYVRVYAFAVAISGSDRVERCASLLPKKLTCTCRVADMGRSPKHSVNDFGCVKHRPGAAQSATPRSLRASGTASNSSAAIFRASAVPKPPAPRVAAFPETHAMAPAFRARALQLLGPDRKPGVT